MSQICFGRRSNREKKDRVCCDFRARVDYPSSSLSVQLSKPLHSFLLPLPAFVSPQDNAPGRSAHVPPLCAALAGSVLLKVVLSILWMGSRDRVAVSSFGSCWGREWTRMINTGVTAESRPACDPSQNMWMGKGNDGVALAL